MGCCQDNIIKPQEETDLTTLNPFTRTFPLKESIKLHYTFQSLLSQTSYSSVHLAIHHQSSNTLSVKSHILSKISSQSFHQLTADLVNFKDIKHPNVLKITEIFKDSLYLHYSTPQCKIHLFDYIVSKNHLSESQAAGFMSQMTSAVQCLHSKKIIHAGLRPESFMFEEGSESVKLINFGSDKFFSQEIYEKIGSGYYTAPEVITGRYDEKSDIWSLGVILHIMLSGYPPFMGNNDLEVLHNSQFNESCFSDRCWKRVSKEVIELIQSMLCKDPRHRPTADEVYSSKWLEKYRHETLSDSLFSFQVIEGLSKFVKNEKLLRSCLDFNGEKLGRDARIIRLKEALENIDEKAEGILLIEDIRNGIKSYSEDIFVNYENLISRMSINLKGKLKLYDFLNALAEQEKCFSKAKLVKSFSQFENEGGLISHVKIMKALEVHQYPNHIFIQLLKEANLIENDEFDLEDFCSHLLERKQINRGH